MMINLATLDPRTKIVVVVVMSFLAVFIRDIFWLLAVMVVTVMLLKLFGVNIRYVLFKLKKFISLFFALLVIQMLFVRSENALIEVGRFTIVTYEGVEEGFLVILRMFIIIFSSMILTTSSYQEIIQGLVKWKMPYDIAFMLFLGVRFLPVLTEEIKDTFIAIQLRGLNIKSVSLKDKIRICVCIFMPVVAGLILKAKKLALVMETRAFRAYPTRTFLEERRLNSKDYIIIFAVLLFGFSYYAFYYTCQGGFGIEGIFSCWSE